VASTGRSCRVLPTTSDTMRNSPVWLISAAPPVSLTSSGLGAVVGVTIDARMVAPGFAAALALEVVELGLEAELALPHAASTEPRAVVDMPTTTARETN
jgi:hypothetical protein